MKRAAILACLALMGVSEAASAREAVDASAPAKVSVTIYRDPYRGEGDKIDPDWPQGFAMISETRTVTLPPGESTIRFEGVAEGMVAVTAIVTGLPGGTIEKNRNADLLSPASLVDGTLGNRVTVTRTNPATGAAMSQDAIIRTRADGGLVLQTQQGFEAVQCSGLPEKLAFDHVPAGLSAQPVFSIDTRDASGGTYQVVLTYLAWGFDWQAHYVATLADPNKPGKQTMHLRSWLTLLNDNGQSFPDAELMAVAGKLNIESDFQDLSDPPTARPLRLTCYPLGSTAAGSYPPPPPPPPPSPPPPPAAMAFAADEVIVTAQRMEKAARSAPAMLASEEQLGDLKLYRVPEPVTVAAQSLKQIAFIDRGDVEAELEYRVRCSPWDADDGFDPARIVLTTKNDKQHGLGMALPTGGVTLFEPSSAGELLVGEEWLRDYAVGQDVEIELSDSTTVFGQCAALGEDDPYADGMPWLPHKATVTNANGAPVKLRLELGWSSDWKIRGKVKGLSVKDGQWVIERTIAAGERAEIAWQIRSSQAADE